MCKKKNFIEIRSSDLKKAIWFMSRQVNKSQQTGTLLKGLPPSMKVPLLENQHQSFGNPEDRSAVTGGTTVVSDYLVIRVTSENGQSFLDKMIAMVEGTQRKKHPMKSGCKSFDHFDDHFLNSFDYADPVYSL